MNKEELIQEVAKLIYDNYAEIQTGEMQNMLEPYSKLSELERYREEKRAEELIYKLFKPDSSNLHYEKALSLLSEIMWCPAKYNHTCSFPEKERGIYECSPRGELILSEYCREYNPERGKIRFDLFKTCWDKYISQELSLLDASQKSPEASTFDQTSQGGSLVSRS